MKKHWTIITAGIIIAIAGCSKVDVNVGRFAGVYEIYKYELHYYGGDNTEDSSKTYNNIGTMGLYDNGSPSYNFFTFTNDSVPRSWIDYGIGIPTAWFPDESRGNTVSLVGPDYDQFIIYTVEKEGRKKSKWVLVRIQPSGALDYIETLYLEKLK